jgi:hypothetical protein
MESYSIPVRLPQVEQQLKAAKLIHLLSAFLLIANAWGAFRSTTHPSLLFVVVQIALSILILSMVLGGKTIYPNKAKSNRIFRFVEAAGFGYAAYFFYTDMHLSLMSFFQVVIGGGLLYLWLHERKVFSQQEVLVNTNEVVLPAILNQKKISWKEIDNLRIRNDYISINTRQNKFIQFEVAASYSESELDEMNAWCFRHLTANGVGHTP